MEGFGGFFNDPDFQRRLQEMAETPLPDLPPADDPDYSDVEAQRAEIGETIVLARKELRRRAWLRVLHGVPEDARGACRFVVGNERLLNELFDRFQHGEDPDAALAALGAVAGS